MFSQTVNELTASSSQNSLTDGFPSSSYQSSLSLSGSGVAGYSQNPMPAGSFVCADGIPRSDLSCGEIAVFSGKYFSNTIFSIREEDVPGACLW